MPWFRTNNYPDFWKDYTNRFKNTEPKPINDIRFIVFDTETTGLDIKKDRILSIGTLGITNFTIHVSDQLEVYVKQDIFKAETVKIHGLLKNGKTSQTEETEAVKEFINHIKDAVLVAHHVAFDVAMINAVLHRMKLPKLKNEFIDTGYLFKLTKHNRNNMLHFSLDDLSQRFNIPQHDRHTASGDALITALLFLKLVSILKQEKTDLQLKDLTLPKQRLGLL
jgi:DNA polymerase-3 subunit epsilon